MTPWLSLIPFSIGMAEKVGDKLWCVWYNNINGNEYLLTDNGSLRTFESRDIAETFLMVNGETLDSIANNYVIEDYRQES